MNTCKECGFGEATIGAFCSETCKVFNKRRTTDPQYWTNLPRAAAEKQPMSEETKQKLRDLNAQRKAARAAEAAAFEADNEAASNEAKELGLE